MPSKTEPSGTRQRIGIVGVGKMGISHLAIARAHPQLDVVGVCDNTPLVLSGIRSQLELDTFKNFETMVDEAGLDGVFVATPTSSHAPLADYAIDHGVSVFVEKPLTLSAAQSRQLADAADAKGVANQVGYHNRFIGTFREVARLVAAGAIGDIHHVDGRAFGQVVTKAKGGGRTWRAQKSEGGGCLHDYACHVIDLMNFVAGKPEAVVGARLASIYSTNVEDAVYAMFHYPNGAVGTLETNWSDPAYRKMTTSITVYGTKGKIYADRQECRLYLREEATFEDFEPGWTIRYITELQDPVAFYLRGEEYSAQVDSFAAATAGNDSHCENSFSSAADADWLVEEITRVHEEGGRPAAATEALSSGTVDLTAVPSSDLVRAAAAQIYERGSDAARKAVDRLREAKGSAAGGTR